MPAFPPVAPLPVSVVIPAFDAEATLVRALDSVAAQDHAPIEVIVVDDASRDRTAEIARAYAKLPVRLVSQTANGGVAAAMNAGIAAARHAHIAFLDADDEWLPGKLARQSAAYRADPSLAFVATGFERATREAGKSSTYGLEPFAHEGADFWRNLLLDSAIHKSSMLARRDFILAEGGFDAALPVAEDQDLIFRLALRGPVLNIPELLLRYHETPGSLTTRHLDADVTYVLPMIDRHLALVGDRLSPAQRRAVVARRNGITAQNLADAGLWTRALPYAARALLRGDRPAEHVSRLLTTAPGIRHLKRLLRGR